MVVNVLGRNIEATIGTVRKVEWENLGINFVMVFSPNTFNGAPVTNLATLTFPVVDAGPRDRLPVRGDRRLPDCHHGAGQGGAGLSALVAQLALGIRGAASSR